MSRIKVAVLGCGPAGLMAAHAATRWGAEVDVFSRINKSRIGGAQYLYTPIPGVTGSKPDAQCTVYKRGTRADYAEKVYGNRNAPTSWSEFEDEQVVDVWSMRQAYDRLWSIYGNGIVDMDVSVQQLLMAGGVYDEYDFTLCCIPRTVLCITKQHKFTMQDVWISQKEHEYEGDNWIEYDGTINHPSAPEWYRASSLFGHEGFEYASKPQDQSESSLLKISKPLTHDCDCWDKSNKMKFMGRYGLWRKGVLIHHAYYETEAMLTKEAS